MKNQRGFIQISLLIAIIAGVLIVGGGGYFGVKQYQNYRVQEIEKERVAQETTQEKEKQAEEERKKQESEITKLREAVEALKNKKPETITQTIIKEVPIQKSENDLPTVIKQWRPIIAYIECDFLYSPATGGSGMALRFSGDKFGILTNAHVVGGKTAPQSCKVIFPDDNSAPLISTHNRLADSGKDWGIVDIYNPSEYMKNITATNPKICTQKPSVGERIVILGYPGIGSQTDITATEGIISGYDGDYFITSAKVEHGNSGGAAILIKENCYLGIPSFVQVGSVESLARIFDISKL